MFMWKYEYFLVYLKKIILKKMEKFSIYDVAWWLIISKFFFFL